MKIKILIVFILFLGFSIQASAQQVQIVNVQGKVQARKDANSSWELVKNGDVFTKEAELKTSGKGKCLILFGEDKKNSMTLEKNSQIKLESIVPGDVFLSKGRVFTLIKQSDQTQDFKVRTPTAIAGARGTGWVTEFVGGVTSVFVFEDNVDVSGLDKAGEVVSQVEIQENFSTTVTAEGNTSEIERVPEIEKQHWQEEVKVMEQVIAEILDKPVGPEVIGPMRGGPKEMQQVIEKMKESGQYSPEEIRKMQQMSREKIETMKPEDMQNVTRVMQEMGMLNPQEQAMVEEINSRKQEIDAMNPEERREFFRQLEVQYGLGHDNQDSTTDGYDDPSGRNLPGRNLQSGPPDRGEPSDRRNPETDRHPPSDSPSDRPFFDGDSTGNENPHDGTHDPFFGEFDNNWYGTTGGPNILDNGFEQAYDENKNNIHPCHCQPNHCLEFPPPSGICPP